MFELLFAWAVFTAVLGRSAESVMHAWKGTAPPSHLRKMARIRAQEAAHLRQGQQPAGPARTWARTVWGDAWDAATERHAERWPTKAAKKRQAARARWAWWDDVEDRAGHRWDERRARRFAGEPETAKPAEEPATGSDKKTAKPAEEPATGSDKKTAKPADTSLGLADLQRLSEANLAARQRKKRGFGQPSDTPDTNPKTPGERADGGVRDPRTPGHRPVSGGGPTIPSTRPTNTTETEGADDMAEVINLEGATKFSRALDSSYNASLERLDEVTAWLRQEGITSGRLYDRFTAIMRTTADVTELTKRAVDSCEDQLKVRDAVEAAGGDAMSKQSLITD